jgi:Kef-type K+ transport system membrane component KefB
MTNMLFLLGFIILAASAVGQLFRRLGIPQVVGFIIAGVILGPSALSIIPIEMNDNLSFLSEIALGLIGFDMGGHLRFTELRRLGKSILFIVMFEAFGAFALVASGVYLISRSVPTALVFGALASATAPAATVDVLAEYQSDGPLTTTLLAVVGLDDAVSLLLFSAAAAIAEAYLRGTSVSVLAMMEIPLIEISESILIGAGFGLALNWIMRRINGRHDNMAIAIAAVFMCVGLSDPLHISLILTSMVMGIVVVNRNHEHGDYIRFTIEQAGPVIYVLFFALIGARLRIDLLPAMGAIGIAYVVLRSTGKYAGAWIGGRLGEAEPAVQKNLGLALLSQAGVAIGLAMSSYDRFCACGELGEEIGELVLNVITATTLVVQIIGPIGVKIAITRAGEVGKARVITVGD